MLRLDAVNHRVHVIYSFTSPSWQHGDSLFSCRLRRLAPQYCGIRNFAKYSKEWQMLPPLELIFIGRFDGLAHAARSRADPVHEALVVFALPVFCPTSTTFIVIHTHRRADLRHWHGAQIADTSWGVKSLVGRLARANTRDSNAIWYA